MDLVELIKQILLILTLAGQIIFVGLLAAFFTRQKPVFAFVAKNVLFLGFVVAFTATLGSLFYSEIEGFEPCKLCWFQRIFMYPQVLLLGLAWLKKDFGMVRYSVILSSIGAIIAAYHYLLQIGVTPALSCSAVDVSAACSQRFVMAFGYITIPMMALTAFVLIGTFMAIYIKESKKKSSV